MKAYNIKWDTDGDKKLLKSLPKEVELPADEFNFDNYEDEDELLDAVSDWLSDEYGFCHDGFDVDMDDGGVEK